MKRLFVLRNLCSDLILGHDFLKLHKDIILSFNGPEDSLKICRVSLANIKPVSLFSTISSKCHPIATKSRRYNEIDTKFIMQEIDNLLSDGIIEKSCSPWRAQVLITKTENHKRRMCIDYSLTVNRFTSLDAYPLPNIYDIVQKAAKYSIFSTRSGI